MKEGQRFSDVAKMCEMDVATLSADNKQITNINVVSIGQHVCVPAVCCEEDKIVCITVDAQPPASPSVGKADTGKHGPTC